MTRAPRTSTRRTEPKGRASSSERIVAALRYIREHACRGVTVEEVVSRVTVPRHDLERGFRMFIGRSPQAEIRRVQLAEIKRLLQYTNKPLKDIADLTGFEYVEYMCVLFKRLVGETPGKFRKAIRSGQSSRSAEKTGLPAIPPREYAVSAS